MKSIASLRPALLAMCFAGPLLESADAALAITLHPDGSGGTIIEVTGSGTTGGPGISQLSTSLNQEQWLDMTGNPFKDAYDNAIFNLVTPITIAPGVQITAIELDSDGLTDAVGSDDFRIFVSATMAANTAYSANGFSSFTTPVNHADLNVGTYTDDTDGATTFLGGFTLAVDNSLVVPEPSGTLLTLVAVGLTALRRKRC